MDLIWANWEGIYFRAKDWTDSISLIGFDKSSRLAQTVFAEFCAPGRRHRCE
jgi:hypothetical protein